MPDFSIDMFEISGGAAISILINAAINMVVVHLMKYSTRTHMEGLIYKIVLIITVRTVITPYGQANHLPNVRRNLSRSHTVVS